MFSVSLVERAKSLVQRRVPISSWLPRYRKIDAVSDAIAGITVGLTMMPQSIAYASLAGLSAQVKHSRIAFDSKICVVHFFHTTYHEKYANTNKVYERNIKHSARRVVFRFWNHDLGASFRRLN